RKGRRYTRNSTAHGTTMATIAGAAISAANLSGEYPDSRLAASRLVRLETGRSSDAEFASHTVVRAKGMTGNSTDRATTMTTGVRRTAVVSSDRKIVDAVVRN